MEQAYVGLTRDETRSGEVDENKHRVEIVRPLSNILRSEWDRSMAAASNPVPTGLAVIEGLVSVYRVQKQMYSVGEL